MFDYNEKGSSISGRPMSSPLGKYLGKFENEFCSQMYRLPNSRWSTFGHISHGAWQKGLMAHAYDRCVKPKKNTIVLPTIRMVSIPGAM